MDPYRLGAKADKMAGLIDFGSAFESDVCLIEWPDRMPKGERGGNVGGREDRAPCLFESEQQC